MKEYSRITTTHMYIQIVICPKIATQHIKRKTKYNHSYIQIMCTESKRKLRKNYKPITVRMDIRKTKAKILYALRKKERKNKKHICFQFQISPSNQINKMLIKDYAEQI